MRGVQDCETVLIVEDDLPIMETLRELLELEGYKVITAMDGKEALSQLKSFGRPCLILLDMFMPVMDGWQFLEEFRRDPELVANVPVIITSAAGERAAQVVNMGYVLLRKPFDLEVLLATVKRYCTPVPDLSGPCPAPGSKIVSEGELTKGERMDARLRCVDTSRRRARSES